MPLIHVEDQLAIPRGMVYFDPYDASGALTGEIELGNCPGVTISIDSEKAEHYSSKTSQGEKDRSLTTRINRTGSLNCDNCSGENYALWLSGTRQVVQQTAVAVTGELRAVLPGRFYQLGATAANPLGVRGVTAVSVKDEAGTNPFEAGVDYNVDLDTGRVQIVEGGEIVAGKVQFAYTPVAGKFERVKTGGKAEVLGALRIVADNASGANRDFYMPKVTLTPTGDLPVITEGNSNDFVQLQFNLEVLKPSNAEAINVDGRPLPA